MERLLTGRTKAIAGIVGDHACIGTVVANPDAGEIPGQDAGVNPLTPVGVPQPVGPSYPAVPVHR